LGWSDSKEGKSRSFEGIDISPTPFTSYPPSSQVIKIRRTAGSTEDVFMILPEIFKRDSIV
jgi:hypothetical protein